MNLTAHRFLGILWVTLAAAGLAAAGCGGGTPGGGGGSSGGGTVSGGGTAGGGTAGGSNQGSVILSVNEASAPDSIGGLAPAKGRAFAEVDITLEDVSTPSPIPAAFAYFSLSTTNGLVLTPSVASGNVAKPCSGDISIAAGSKFTCDIAFEVPTDDSPKQLSYDDHNGHTATAPVPQPPPPPPPDPCETVWSWKNDTGNACVQCKDASCKSLKDEWLAEENDGHTCPNASTCTCTNQNVCPCEGACMGACKPAWYAYLQCVIDNCTSPCM